MEPLVETNRVADSRVTRGGDNAPLTSHQARALETRGKLSEALHSIERCLELDPHNYANVITRADILEKMGRFEDALASYANASALRPLAPHAQVKSAHLLYRLHRHAESLDSIERAIELDPSDLLAINTRGMIFESTGRFTEALADFDRVLTQRAHDPDVINNRGMILARFGRFEEAIECYKRVLSLKPGDVAARYNLCMARLALGDWARGLREFEIRWDIAPPEAKRWSNLGQRWYGDADIRGKTILLHHEQGYGDTLQFVRYAPLVAARGAVVVIAVPKALLCLMISLTGQYRIVTEGDPVPPHDYYCPLMSLPLAFGTTPATVPAAVPYLSPDPKRVERFGAILGTRRRMRVGIAWSGRCYPPVNYARDVPLRLLQNLFKIDADFHSLQIDIFPADSPIAASIPNLKSIPDQVRDFADTAALIANMDLIITVDTAIAHLAGAMGMQTWVLHRYAACWRWLQGRADTPWYPTMRLFRQTSPGDWTIAINSMKQAAASLVAGQSSSTAVLPHRATSLDPHGSCAQLEIALAEHREGRLSEATRLYRASLESDGNQVDALHGLGIALAQAGRLTDAIDCLSAAIGLRPSNPVIYTNLGNAQVSANQYVKALESFRRALALNPASADSFYGCGKSYQGLGDPKAALTSYDHAIRLRANYPEALNNRGTICQQYRHYEEALKHFDAAIALDPSFADALINRACALRELHRLEESKISSKEAISVAPNRCEGHNALGAALAGLGCYHEALRCYARALSLNPDYPEARWNQALIQLLQGNFAEGWTGFEMRRQVKSLGLLDVYPAETAWHGDESLSGKSILLYAEQGYGDTIQFSRYVAAVRAQAAHVTLQAPEALAPILGGISGVDELVAQSIRPAFDFHCSLMSLPLLLGANATSIPSVVPYLAINERKAASWRERLGERVRPRVGLVWSGRLTHRNDNNRSIPLRTLLPVIDGRFEWISLQKDPRTDDICTLSEGIGARIRHFGGELSDFAQTAALIAHLDLVISVDTAVAHLAGALAKPVWILLPVVPDWRWQLDRSDSPWYPTARLIRQTVFGDWADVVRNITAGLENGDFL